MQVQEIERDVIEVMKSERIEKECRQAEMQANKAQNMMEHREEIYSRPAKRWFQTAQEKFSIQEQVMHSVRQILAYIWCVAVLCTSNRP